MKIFEYIYLLIRYAVVAFILYVVVIVLLRWIVNKADMNPFGTFAQGVRHYSDKVVGPVRSHLLRVGFNHRFAPILTILMAALGGYFFLQFCSAVLFTISGSIASLRNGAIVPLVGYLLYGLLSVLSLMILVRIIIGWLMIHGNRLTKFLYRFTEPVLAPFRRLIPPVGMIDISPIIVIVLIGLFQQAIYGTLIMSSGPMMPR